ncbi:helix-turn-helix transcriptional regulator [Paenibacillus sp. CFBP 13594]|uniref:helix-turn-helix domain-containing protein n=1 Tax=Paenibacillus sp. CFBP 13594 TaxID=2774037 RepID=UPI0017802276|nr:helix-turn-helix transcriptional regulator [Paenibacillus sp. CFBP 13594]MBD8839445.1 helix-turn-helix transcriptional regulator [Paenibacillus sp. CFBP 13594]
MSIGLEYITKIFGGSYTDVAKRLDITPQTVSDWIRGKRNISSSKIDELAALFKLDKHLFQKELTEVEKIEIELDYLNRLSKRDVMLVPESNDTYNPHSDMIESKLRELENNKLLLRVKRLLYSNSSNIFNSIDDLITSIEKK